MSKPELVIIIIQTMNFHQWHHMMLMEHLI